MLGGKRAWLIAGNSEKYQYYINSANEIDAKYQLDDKFIVFTLEEFLEKFPYKVGDKVYYDNKVCDVIEMLWNNNLNTISYGVYDGKMKNLTIVEDLKPYKEETISKNICDSCLDNEGCWVECFRKKQEREKETKKDLDWSPTEYLEFENNYDAWANEVEVNLGNDYEIQIRDGKTFIVRKSPQYPKTYEECHKLMVQWKEYDCNPNSELILCESPIHDFCKIIVARNIYWKIAGEQMGMEKPWKPDYDSGIDKYGIIISFNAITKTENSTQWERHVNKILEFPTAEMRDIFLENFKDLIESCKELL